MPIYEYKCSNEACDTVEEERRDVADREKPKTCVKCNAPMKPIMSLTQARFPGAGSWRGA